MTARPFDLAQTDKLLTTTRSVRKRLDLEAPVDLDEIQECIGIACQAPTGGNVQDWRWIVVTDPAKRAELAELYNRAAGPLLRRQPRRRSPSAASPTWTRSSTRPSTWPHLAEVPVHVVPCIFGRPEDMDVFTRASWYGRIYPAVWSLILALRSRGYGTTLTTLHLPFEAEAAELLGIPDHRAPGGAAADRPLHGRRLQAGSAPPGRGDHLLGRLEGAAATHRSAERRGTLSGDEDATASRVRRPCAGRDDRGGLSRQPALHAAGDASSRSHYVDRRRPRLRALRLRRRRPRPLCLQRRRRQCGPPHLRQRHRSQLRQRRGCAPGRRSSPATRCSSAASGRGSTSTTGAPSSPAANRRSGPPTSTGWPTSACRPSMCRRRNSAPPNDVVDAAPAATDHRPRPPTAACASSRGTCPRSRIPPLDLRKLVAIARLGVDGVGVDIEGREVADVAERNRRLVDLSIALRQHLPCMPIWPRSSCPRSSWRS